MQNAIFLNNPLQTYLVKQAVANEIKRYKAKGFRDSDFEVVQLRGALPQLKELNGVPVDEAEKEATNG
jgi:hypothetical protein